MLAVWKHENMQTMLDMLRYYNNHDVGPFLQALMKMANHWWDTEGIDMFDHMSIPGIAEEALMKTRSPYSYFMLPQKPRRFPRAKKSKGKKSKADLRACLFCLVG